jgi:hypothetical protein
MICENRKEVEGCTLGGRCNKRRGDSTSTWSMKATDNDTLLLARLGFQTSPWMSLCSAGPENETHGHVYDEVLAMDDHQVVAKSDGNQRNNPTERCTNNDPNHRSQTRQNEAIKQSNKEPNNQTNNQTIKQSNNQTIKQSNNQTNPSRHCVFRCFFFFFFFFFCSYW